MLKFAILQEVKRDGQVFYRPILEGEDGEFVRELASRVKRILGPKESFTSGEVTASIEAAYDEYKKAFKEKTVKIP